MNDHPHEDTTEAAPDPDTDRVVPVHRQVRPCVLACGVRDDLSVDVTVKDAKVTCPACLALKGGE